MKLGTLRARSTLLFLLVLLLAGMLVWWIEQLTRDLPRARSAAVQQEIKKSADLPALPAPRALTEQELQWARIAWTYFERNTDADTGLVHSVDGFPSTTLWDTASALLALLSAQRLQLITQAEYDQRTRKMLDALARLPLVDERMPNKAYHTATLAMVDYANQPAPRGIGWSALDIARLIVPLQAIAWRTPQHAPAAAAVLKRFDLRQLTADGQLWGGMLDADGNWKRVQEGRLGYEQYGARSYALFGLDVARAADWRAYLDYVEVEGVQLPHDSRSVEALAAVDYVTSEPYVLDGLEYGWDSLSREFAWRVYQAQERRTQRTNTLTAVTEDHLDQAPFFIYSTVYAAGRDWNVLTPTHADAINFRNLSVKAAFGWHALYRRPHTEKLVQAVAGLHDPQRGWLTGLYEKTGQPNRSINCNTNAVVLESLAFIAGGRLLP